MEIRYLHFCGHSASNPAFSAKIYDSQAGTRFPRVLSQLPFRTSSSSTTRPYQHTRKQNMATAKTPAKKTAAKKVAAPVKQVVRKPVQQEQMHSMPQEVKDWIDRASSTMKHQATQIAAMKEEIVQLKAYKKFAANKIQGMSYE